MRTNCGYGARYVNLKLFQGLTVFPADIVGIAPMKLLYNLSLRDAIEIKQLL